MSDNDARASRLVSARQKAIGLSAYPGTLPSSVDEAYAIQDLAIAAWPDAIVGWKVGGVNREWGDRLSLRYIMGPIFYGSVREASEAATPMPVFANGFAAVEAEITAIIGQDAPPEKTAYSHSEARDFVSSLSVSAEIASSPFTGINEFGPLVTISDFGNNNGLILGTEIPNWQDLSYEAWAFEAQINGRSVGAASPQEGATIEAVRFALETAARRGIPLKAGMKISTGAITGIHQADAGDQAEIIFQGATVISLKLTPAIGQTVA